ncbi:MAG: hypothetical protein RR620_02840 [Clostridium sp.]
MTDDQIKDIVIALINNGRIATYDDSEKNAKDVAKVIKVLREKVE